MLNKVEYNFSNEAIMKEASIDLNENIKEDYFTYVNVGQEEKVAKLSEAMHNTSLKHEEHKKLIESVKAQKTVVGIKEGNIEDRL